MPKGYHHLTYEQRCQIEALLKSGISRSGCADQLGVHRSAITRELARNSGGRGYRFKQAQGKTDERRRKAAKARNKMTPALIARIEADLTERQWSPEQIAGRLRLEGGPSVSHERIYQHIRADKKAGGTLWKHLRHRGKPYNVGKKGKTAGRGLIPGRVDIDQRPAVVEQKSRIGDWEGDTIIGKAHKGAIASHVDRASKLTKLTLLPDKAAEGVVNACRSALLPLADFVHTITYDNGKEFARHQEISAMLDAKIYFAKPYHSWERGLNEHTNGLVRQYFPKGTDLAILTSDEVQAVEDKLNNRPRKTLGFRTPLEVFSSTVALRP